jgi:hypothetical protein
LNELSPGHRHLFRTPEAEGEPDAQIVTHNTQDYANIPGLNLEDWLVP